MNLNLIEIVDKVVLLGRIGQFSEERVVVVDITVKNNPNHILAPTWELVMGLKKGTITWSQYRERYLNLSCKRFRQNKTPFIRGLKKLVEYYYEGKKVALVCYCADEKKCHRSLAREFLVKLARDVEKEVNI